MDKHASRRTILKPLLSVFFLALVSYPVYYGSRRIENRPVQEILPTLRSLVEASA